MSPVFTIGSVLVDIFVHSAEFVFEQKNDQVWLCQAYGQKNELDSLAVRTGGGAGNTAVAFKRLGLEAAVVAELGKDEFAQVVVSDLQKNQLKTEYLVSEAKEQTGGSVILLGADGGRTVMVHRGAAAELNVSDIPTTALSKARWIHLSSIGGHPDVLKTIFSLARLESIGLSWNPGKAELEHLAEHGPGSLGLACEILFVNAEEWSLIEKVHPAVLSAVPIIVVTDGKAGGKVLRHGQVDLPYSAASTTSIDDTGAGDAFAATFVAATLLDQSVETAITWAVANASSVVQQIGAKPGLLSRSELERMVVSS